LPAHNAIDHIVQAYGDLVFDLCDSILWSPSHTQIAFRSILKKARSIGRFQKFSNYERSWVLRIACSKLLVLHEKYGHSISLQEQIKMNANANLSYKLKQFKFYFHRLAVEDQILLFLKDKYDIPYFEISTALAIPEGSLKIRRQQALRTLEEWLWNSR
jgi:DNA-directed RNA polymerase specialized sigma24 family protein